MPSIAKVAILVAAFIFGAHSYPRATWCTFWMDDTCNTTRSGGSNYDTSNGGIFQNGGPYFSCQAISFFSLISYPLGDYDGTKPKNCFFFTNDEDATPDQTPNRCIHLDDLGFKTGDGGYYRVENAVDREDKCPTLVPSK